MGGRRVRVLAALSVGATAAVALPRSRRSSTPRRPVAAPPVDRAELRAEPAALPVVDVAPPAESPPAPQRAPAPPRETRPRAPRAIRMIAAICVGGAVAAALPIGTSLVAHPSRLSALHAPTGPPPRVKPPGQVRSGPIAGLLRYQAPRIPPPLRPPVRHTHALQTVWLAPFRAKATVKSTSTPKSRPRSTSSVGRHHTTQHRSPTRPWPPSDGWGGDE